MSKRKYENICNLLGSRFKKLVVMEILEETDRHKHKLIKCLCDCGNTKIVTGNRFRRREVGSCGCLRRDPVYKKEEITYRPARENSKINNPWIASAKNVYSKYKDGNLSFEDFLKLSQKNCYYCDNKPQNVNNHYITKYKKFSKERINNGYFTYNGLDRVDNTRKHDLDNVVPCCIICNKAKLDKSQQSFFLWIKKVYDFHHLSDIKL